VGKMVRVGDMTHLMDGVTRLMGGGHDSPDMA